MLAAERRRYAAGALLAVAVLKDDLGRVLNEQDLFAAGSSVERRHEFVFRFERDGINARA